MDSILASEGGLGAALESPIALSMKESAVEAPSTAESAPAQEQQPTAYTQEQVNEMLARRERELQSAKDRELHRARLQAQAEVDAARRASEEQARLENMDDEDYGRYVREKVTKDQELGAQASAHVTRAMLDVQAQTLSQITDADKRAEIEGKINDGQYKSWGDLIGDVVTAAVAAQLAKESKVVKEAARKEATAEIANIPVPVLGSGTNSTRSTRPMSSSDLFSQGFAEALQAARK